jgi:hypothetical protein
LEIGNGLGWLPLESVYLTAHGERTSHTARIEPTTNDELLNVSGSEL